MPHSHCYDPQGDVAYFKYFPDFGLYLMKTWSDGLFFLLNKTSKNKT